jgi:hypothetical protein
MSCAEKIEVYGVYAISISQSLNYIHTLQRTQMLLSYIVCIQAVETLENSFQD